MILVFVVLFVLAVTAAVYLYVRRQDDREALLGIYCNSVPEHYAPECYFELSSIHIAAGTALGKELGSAHPDREEVIAKFAIVQAEKANAVGATFADAIRWMSFGLHCRRKSWRSGRHLRMTGGEFGGRVSLYDGTGTRLSAMSDSVTFFSQDIEGRDWTLCDEHGQEVRRGE